jgi:hypothetical protein
MGDSAILADPKDRFRSSTDCSISSLVLAKLAKNWNCLPLCSGVRFVDDLGEGTAGTGGLRTVSGALNVNSECASGVWNMKGECES